MKGLKKSISLLLTILMIVSMFPISAIPTMAVQISSGDNVTVVAGETVTAEINNTLVTGGMRIVKYDGDFDANEPQGDSTLDGVQFRIKNVSGETIKFTDSDGTRWIPNNSYMTTASGAVRVFIGVNGVVETPNNMFSYGNYSVTEYQPSDGYLNDNSWEKIVEIRNQGQIHTISQSESNHDDIIRSGDISVQKFDTDRYNLDSPQNGIPQGDGTLENAKIRVVNSSAHPIFYNGNRIPVGGVVADMPTDARGFAKISGLPYGTYTLTEYEPSTGYMLNSTWTQTVVVRANGEVQYFGTNAATKAKALREQTKLYEIQIQKNDMDLNENLALGAAVNLKGAKFEIINKSPKSIFYKGREVPSNGQVDIITTDENGFTTTGKTLPYGTYYVHEVAAPEGYKVNTSWNYTFVCHGNDGQIYKQTMLDQVKRGDVHFNKDDFSTSEGLANVVFRVTSETTGESHIVVTDMNGVFNSSGDPAAGLTGKHSVHTNSNDAAVDGNNNVNESQLDSTSGVWFHGRTDRTTPVRDNAGAFPYDTYTFEELRSSANTGRSLQTFTVSIREDGQVIDRGTVNDHDAPRIGTLFLDSDTRDHTSSSAGRVTLVDRVTYENCVMGHNYIIRGTLIDKSTGRALRVDGSDATAEYTFTPESSNGYIDLEFTMDGSSIGGKTVVAFVSLYEGSTELYTSDDIDNEDETIYFPAIRTTLTDLNGSKEVAADETITLIDTVTYENLIPYQTYVVTGYLVDKATGENVVDGNGTPIEASTSFRPSEPNGTVNVVFTFNPENVLGKTIVAFEDLTRNAVIVATHHEINDDAQTVSIPKIGTSLGDDQNNHVVEATENMVLVDTVAYEGLVPNTSYKVVGTLMDKLTQTPLRDSSNNVITAEKTFTPASSDGTVQINFEFNGLDVAGRAVVAFEVLYKNDLVAAKHEDINDEGQTVYIPKIRTTLAGFNDEKEFLADGHVRTVIDTVKYSGLKVGETYVMSGSLINKATGASIAEASTEFLATSPEGSVQLSFDINTESMEANSVVAFEELTLNSRLVAQHKDIDDADQTVSFPKIRTLAKDENGEKETLAASDHVITDTVTYENLIPGKSYTLSASIVDTYDGKTPKDTGKYEAFTGTTTFIPETPNGTVDVDILFDSSNIAGMTVCVFETLTNANREVIAEHKDLTDTNQIITIPGIRTTLVSEIDEEVAYASEAIVLTDTVVYENLVPQKEYTVTGTLMDKLTGEPATDAQGNVLEQSKSFTPDSPNGSVDVTFVFDASNMVGKTLVAFEDLYNDHGIKVAIHADFDDEDQSIKFPEIKTSASTVNHEKEILAEGNVVIIDSVSYENLKPEKKYIMKGSLVDKDNPTVVIAEGETEFIPTSTHGHVAVRFSFTSDLLEGKKLVAFEKLTLVNGDVVATHEDVDDEDQTVSFPKIRTTAADENGKKEILAEGVIRLVDTVVYENLIPGQNYSLTATLMNKDNGEPMKDVYGANITATQPFTPEEANGSVDVTFEFDASHMANKTAVAYEKLSNEIGLVAKHEDLTDKDQTVTFPEIHTCLQSDEGTHIVLAEENAHLVDTVSFDNLVVGNIYVIRGKLMNRQTGEQIVDARGEPVEAESVPFKALQSSGTWTVEFTFDASELENTTVVAFEELKLRDEDGILAKHEDLTDVEQAVQIPKIRTTAVDGMGQHEINPDGTVYITDTVTYNNLIVNKTYTVNGKLVDKSNPDNVLATGTTTFKAKDTDGTVEVKFTFDATGLEAKTFVAFEELKLDDVVIAIHEDLDDEAQTIKFPKIRTRAHGPSDQQEFLAEGIVTIVDTVTYENLTPGKTYILNATLMDKGTGVALKDINGNPITSEASFVPESESGSTDVTFVFDASQMKNKTAVAFERLSNEVTMIATHEDINDEEQTVTFPEIRTTLISDAGTHMALAEKQLVLTDTVVYKNLKIGTKYTVVGKLKDKVTGRDVLDDAGNPVTAENTFTAETVDGSVEITFIFDAETLEGHSVVAFEQLSNELEVVAKHEDLTDEDQIVTIPKVRTSALSEKGKHEVLPSGRITINDVVVYENLVAGQTYTLKGQLVNKEDSNDILAIGETTFKVKPNDEDGSVIVKFTFDADYLDGTKYVAYEQLFFGDQLIAIHEDINDADQTINFPKFHTDAHDENGNKELNATTSDYFNLFEDAFNEDPEGAPVQTLRAAGHRPGMSANGHSQKLKILDTVYYENMTPGEQYTIEGFLEDEDTGKYLRDDEGDFITSSITFVIDEPDGQVDVVFEIDPTGLEGKTIIIRERIYDRDGDQIAVERDFSNQYIYFPKIRTTLADENGAHVTFAGDEVVLSDTIAYWNLRPGQEYMVQGMLMNPETEEVVRDSNDKPVIARGVFTPEEEDGVVTIDFTFDASLIDGTTVVAFEYLRNQTTNTIVGSHEDFTDTDQTVDIPHISTHAFDEDGEQEYFADGIQIITDTVDYDHLQAGEKYVVKAVLIDKETGEPILDPNGQQITAEKRMRAAASSNEDVLYCPCIGQLSNTLKFDASEMEGKTVVVYEYIYHNDVLVAQHVDIDDPMQTITFPKIRTTFHGENGEKEFLADGEVTIIDTVQYWNLVPGKSYTLEAMLMDKTTHQGLKDIYGYDITTTATFTPDEADGEVDVEFVFDASQMKNKTAVAYETLYNDYRIVAEHKDLDDLEQTVTFPEIRTTLVADDGSHVALAMEDLHLTDTVVFKNLLVGHVYTLTGTLMNKETGEPILDAEGNPVTSTSSFEAMATDGSWDIEFTFDASDLAGVSIVAFEELSNEFGVIAEHKDLDDADQTVDIPDIGTYASDEDGNKDFYAETKLTIIDTIEYKNLPIGRYRIEGKLVDKSTGEVLVDAKGKEVIASKTVRIKDTEGTVTLKFTFDASDLTGYTLVAYERFYLDDTLIAIHEDLEDADQTIRFPAIQTEATDQYYQHATNIGTETLIIDRVDYENLTPGETYVISGYLVNKADGKVLKDYAGDEVVSEKSFIPEESSGSIELEFIVDTTELENGALVAYETLLHDDRIVADHKDVNDEAQSVYFPTIRTVAKINGEDVIVIDKDTTSVTIVDTVLYEDVVPNETYVVSGTLMDANDGSVIKDAEGNAIVGTATFTPEERSGSVEVTFEVPITSLSLEAKKITKIVAFERLILGPNTLTTHEDLKDTAQTVYVPIVTNILKLDASSNAPVEGAIFKIEDRGLIKSNERVQLLPEQIVASDAEGKVYFNVLPKHEYAITEIQAAELYFLDSAERIVDANALGQLSGDTVIYNIKGGTAVITKTNVVTGAPLQGVAISVYRHVLDEVATERAKQDAAKKLNKSVDKLVLGTDYKNVLKWDLEFTQLTDRKGRIYFYTEEPGEFMYKETATIMGYYLNKDENIFSMDSNMKITGDLSLMNAPYGTVVVQKTDSEGNPLQGAKIAFWDQYDRKLGETVTDAKGRVYFVSPGPGRYYYTEIEAPQGYQRTDNRYHFEVRSDYSIVGELTLVNSRGNGSDRAKTGDTQNPLLWIGLAAGGLCIAATAVVLTGKKRKEEEI